MLKITYMKTLTKQTKTSWSCIVLHLVISLLLKSYWVFLKMYVHLLFISQFCSAPLLDLCQSSIHVFSDTVVYTLFQFRCIIYISAEFVTEKQAKCCSCRILRMNFLTNLAEYFTVEQNFHRTSGWLEGSGKGRAWGFTGCLCYC